MPFTAQTRMSGVNLPDGVKIRKGAPDAIVAYVESEGRRDSAASSTAWSARVGARGATPLAVAENGAHRRRRRARGRAEARHPASAWTQLRLMGLRTVMITGDNPLTAQAIAHEAGVDDFIAEATPEKKLAYLRNEQAAGQARRDDGRRHQRRAVARPGRRRAWR